MSDKGTPDPDRTTALEATMTELTTTETKQTPAEEMRAAATKLRETAKKATRGPWVYYPTVSQDLDVYDRSFTVSRGDCKKENNGEECEPDCGANVVKTGAMGCSEDWLAVDDAAWIALMHPGVAEPLARWLESSAHHAAKVTSFREQMRIADPFAIAVARVINGT
jgi:hypothetical protein